MIRVRRLTSARITDHNFLRNKPTQSWQFVGMMSTQSIPALISAIIQPDTRRSDLLTAKIKTPTPIEEQDEHLIQVKATAICAGELLWYADSPSTTIGDQAKIPCYDLCGIVVKSPKNSSFHPGDEVFGYTNAGNGHARGYTLATSKVLAKKPKSLSWEEAASVPLSALTAWQALFRWGGLIFGKDSISRSQNAKKRVLVTAASGSVGIWIVQLAKLVGVEDIIAVCGPKNIGFVKDLGATEVIDYTLQSLAQWTQAGNAKPDLIIDMVGGETLVQAWIAIDDVGLLISVYADPEDSRPASLSTKSSRSKFFILEASDVMLKQIAALLENGELKVIVDSIWPFEQFREAFAKVETGHARGKVVLSLND